MKLLFEIFETDDYGRNISSLGTIYAEDKDRARRAAGEFYNNKEIYTTGFYGAELVKATIDLKDKKEYWESKVNEANSILRRFKNKETELGEMISFWVEKNGSLDLDTDEAEIREFYNANN
jgi:hypothetical protein